MRLLNSNTLDLHEFFGNGAPNYAILSHRWETEEVSFQDLQAGRGPDMKGWSKIKGCCAQAVLDGWEYVWVDSCCIDKTSSAELSEAINSMFQWYREAKVCYAYLSDVSTDSKWRRQHQVQKSEFRCSMWFTRGWTLQELIAPPTLIFYDSQWEEVGTKRSLEMIISSITGIARTHLRDYTQASVAQKMSWASVRKTTRTEDQAYSLMGLFGVHMSPLYGEGRNAFRRLQLKILAVFDDESLFAWRITGPASGLLADSPLSFENSSDIVKADFDGHRPPFSMTNKGIRAELFLVPHDFIRGWFIAPLNCAHEGDGTHVAIPLFENDWSVLSCSGGGTREFRRKSGLELYSGKSKSLGKAERTVFFVKQIEQPLDQQISFRVFHNAALCRFAFRTTSLLEHGFLMFQGYSIVREEKCRPGNEQIITSQKVARYGEDTGRRITTRGIDRLFILKFTTTKDIFGKQRYGDRKDGVGPRISLPRISWEESFTVVLETDMKLADTCSVNILLPGEPLSDTEPELRGLDRISRTLPWGVSVSAALRLKSDLGKPLYVLDIIIDPDGELIWPDQDNFCENDSSKSVFCETVELEDETDMRVHSSKKCHHIGRP